MESPNISYAGIIAFALVDALIEALAAKGVIDGADQRNILADARTALDAVGSGESNKAVAYVDRQVRRLSRD